MYHLLQLIIIIIFGMKEITTEELMQGEKKITIKHNHRDYFLSITRKGKLILTSAESVRKPPGRLIEFR